MPARSLLPATRQGWAMLGLGVIGALGAGIALWPVSPRQRVAAAALSQIGATDANVYWADVLPQVAPSGYPKDWCGAFALWCLHQAGLAKQYDWVIGIGFLDNLHTTPTPQVGDIAYFDTNEHHAVVVGVDLAAGTVDLVNGNGTGGAVSPSTTSISHAAGYYIIEPLLAGDTTGSPAPWIAASALVIGAGAWVLLPSPE